MALRAIHISLFAFVFLHLTKESVPFDFMQRYALLGRIPIIRRSVETENCCNSPISRTIIFNPASGTIHQPSLIRSSITQPTDGSLLRGLMELELHKQSMLANQLSKENEPITEAKKTGLVPFDFPPPIPSDDLKNTEESKALACAHLPCTSQETAVGAGAVCACNYKTGNVVTFKNECDLRRHNCRFDTEFKTITNEICPWEFESRTGSSQQEADSDYNSSAYFNH